MLIKSIGAGVILLVILIVSFVLYKKTKRKSSLIPTKPSTTRAFNLLVRGKYTEALEELKKISVGGGASTDTYTTAAVLYSQLGDSDKAMHINESLILKRDLNDVTTDEVIYELIKNYRLLGTTGKINDCLQKLSSSGSPCIYLLKAQAAIGSSRFDEALSMTMKYSKATGKECSNDLSNIHYIASLKAQDSNSKVKMLKASILANPQNYRAHTALIKHFEVENKKADLLNSVRNYINGNVMRKLDDLLYLEDLYYNSSTIDDLYQLMYEKVVKSEDSPLAYIYVHNSMIKKADKQNAEKILHQYLDEVGKKIIVAKEYIKTLPDPLLSRVINFEYTYLCNICGQKHHSYTNICYNCGNYDSIVFL